MPDSLYTKKNSAHGNGSVKKFLFDLFQREIGESTESKKLQQQTFQASGLCLCLSCYLLFHGIHRSVYDRWKQQYRLGIRDTDHSNKGKPHSCPQREEVKAQLRYEADQHGQFMPHTSVTHLPWNSWTELQHHLSQQLGKVSKATLNRVRKELPALHAKSCKDLAKCNVCVKYQNMKSGLNKDDPERIKIEKEEKLHLQRAQDQRDKYRDHNAKARY
jgi:hypothetical protein